ncbi:hypothetical protein ACOJIU_18380 (plasmid) [Carnobacterium maltaromaticum]|uniref:hypothetical protein n=1 Tax=Carnobacterium maltaromaticum TaxID=2751 RepID=UPI00344D3C9E
MEEMNQEKKTSKKKWLILVMVLALIVGSGYWYYINRATPEIVSKDLLPELSDASDRSIPETAQRVADENYFTLNINPFAEFPDGESEGTLQIINPETNVYPISVVITLDENSEEVYRSGAIQPNQEIKNAKLSKVLDKGIYEATAIINIYDPVTKEKQGSTQAAITITINN